MLLIKNNRIYDTLKYIAQILLPAVGALYYGLAQVWGLPDADQVVGSIVVVDTFLGVVLHLSSSAYDNSEAKYDGTVDVHETEDKKTFALNLNSDPDEMDKKKDLTFKVNKVHPKK